MLVELPPPTHEYHVGEMLLQRAHNAQEPGLLYASSQLLVHL